MYGQVFIVEIYASVFTKGTFSCTFCCTVSYLDDLIYNYNVAAVSFNCVFNRYWITNTPEY